VAVFQLELSGEGEQRDVACALDGFAEPPLVARARTCHAARQNLAALLHERLKHLDFLVIDEVHVLDAKAANLLLAEILALSAAARTAGPPRPSTFAAWSVSTSSARAAFGAMAATAA
jgi:hypothetical protein